MHDYNMLSGNGHWLFMLAWLAIILPPFWNIFRKAGFSGWLSLLVFVPLVNIVVLYFIAFSEWPSLRIINKTRGSNVSGY